MATIKDVAKRAGVSTGTVSMVINNNPAVKLETRLRVLKAVEELNYTPNQYARALVTKKRNVVGIVRTVVTSYKDAHCGGYHFNELPDTYIADMLDTIVDEVTHLGYSLLFDVLTWDNEDVLQDIDLPSMAQDGRVDGLIWASGFMTARHKQFLQQRHLPVVTVGCRFDTFDWVDTDPEEGVYLMTKYVISCGHRMGRKKKLINKTNVPQYAVERFARCVFDDIRAAYADQEVQAEFARWQAQRAELNTKKKRAATTAALSVYVVFFLRGPLGLESGRMGAPLGKYSCSYLLK